MLCQSCHHPLAHEARFCHRCGVALSTARQRLGEAERRQVTVLFADLGGFTTFSSQRDSEEVATVINACMNALTLVIVQYGGYVDKYLGDGLMALFGAPIAHEDDPHRALRAALAMPEALRQACQDLNMESSFALHVGVSTGPVIAGEFGGELYSEYTVIGDAANLASRLCDQAGDEILVLASTRQLTQEQFEFEVLPPMTLKGIQQAVEPYRLLGLREGGQERWRGNNAHGHVPLLGRDRELLRLREAVQRVAEGRGSTVLVAGEAGIGKSRLLEEMRQRLPSDLHWLEAQALSYRQRVPGAFLRQILANWLGLNEESDEQMLANWLLRHARRISEHESLDLLALMSLLALPLPAEQARRLAELNMETLRQRAFLAAQRWLEGQARGRPTILLLDDLQWMDEVSSAILRLFLPLPKRLPLLLIALSRPPVPEWLQAQVEQTIELEPLPDDQLHKMVRHLLQSERLPTALYKLVAARTEGNPLFVEEMLFTLTEQGVLRKEEEGWQLREAVNVGSLVPDTLYGLLQARIDHLPHKERELLQLASMLGSTFSLELLQLAAEQQGFWDPDTLEALLQAEVLQRVEGRLTFTHTLAREAAYHSMLQRDRRIRHRRIGELLEIQEGRPLAERLTLLVAHFVASDMPEKGLHYTLVAAERACHHFAHEEAVRLYTQAVQLWDEVQPDLPARTLIEEQLGDAQRARGRLAEAIAQWETISLARCEPLQRVRLLRKLGEALTASGRYREAQGCLERALTHLETLNDAEEAWVQAALAHLLFRLGDNAQAIEVGQHALALARQHDLPQVEAQACNTLGCAQARAGQIEAGIQVLEQSLALAQSEQLYGASCRAYTNLAMVYSTVNPERAMTYTLRGLALAWEIGDLTYESWLLSSRAATACQLGVDWEAGLEAAQRAIEIDRTLGFDSHLPVPLILTAQILQCHGAYQASASAYHEALTVSQEIREPQYLFAIYDGLATLALMQGEEGEARRYLAQIEQLCQESDFQPDAFYALPFLA